MIVVSNTSPLASLAAIHALEQELLAFEDITLEY